MLSGWRAIVGFPIRVARPFRRFKFDITKVGGLADKKKLPRRKEKKETLYLVKGVADLGSHD